MFLSGILLLPPLAGMIARQDFKDSFNSGSSFEVVFMGLLGSGCAFGSNALILYGSAECGFHAGNVRVFHRREKGEGDTLLIILFGCWKHSRLEA